MSLLLRFRLSRMTGMRGATAKLDRKQVKKEIHDRWKLRMCGAAKLQIRTVLALCSESTGMQNVTASNVVALAWGNENSNTGLSPSPSSSATTSCIEVSLTFGVPQSVNLFVLHCEKHTLPIHLVRNSFWFRPSHADCQLPEDNQPPQEERWSATMHLLRCDEFRHRTTPTRSPPLKNILQSQIVNFKPNATTSNCNIDHRVPGPETYACLKIGHEHSKILPQIPATSPIGSGRLN